MTTTFAQTLAGFCAGLGPDDIPHEVRDNGALRVLDTVGCALAGSQAAFAPSVLGLAGRWGGGAPCTVVGSSLRASPPLAALVNGCLGHGLDFDDTHAPSITHASAVLVPVILALGEAERLDGRTALSALIAGYEAIARIGMAAPGQFHERGWHATAVCGAFAAALTAGRCLGLPAQSLTAAVGIAASMASGVMEFLEDGSSVKRLHPGWAAHSGVLAAGLARGGFDGPATALEGRFGFYRVALGAAPDMAPLLASLGTRWETLQISVKPYPCCHYVHAYVDAALRIRREHGIEAGSVADIECLVPQGEVPIVCEPLPTKRRPRTSYEAQFSIPFAVAAALVDEGVGVASFAESRLSDPALLAVAARVRYTVDERSPFPRSFPGWVRVRLHDGRVLEARQEQNRGGPEVPLAAAEVVDKFRANAARALPASRVAEVEKAVIGLEGIADLAPVVSLLARD
jgi:2-methylcitrate dehydratase PrpD